MAAIPKDVTRDKAAWQPLIDALRDELQEFGGLIRLLKEEQDAILANPSEVADIPEAIVRQRTLALTSARARNELMTLPGTGGERVPASEPELVGTAPDEIRPLLGALFSEVGMLALRASESACQNAWLRKRAPDIAATMAGRNGAETE